MTEQPSGPTRLHAGVQFTSLLFTAAFLAWMWWTSDSPLNRWIAGPFAVFFVVAGLWKAWRFFQRYPAMH
jgi:hypothetical protein